MKYVIIMLALSLPAHATRAPDHCKPEPKPREPISKPEPKAPDRAPQTKGDHDRPCDRTIGAPVWCKVLK